MTVAGRSFDETASTYAAARPAYPVDAVAWLVPPEASAQRLRGGKCVGARVLDLGAGTGKLTRQLVDAGFSVVSVEPSPQMGAELTAYVPKAELRIGTAEAIPLPAADVDAVVVGSAFHWFEHERALAEIARVLKPGGSLGLVRNRPDDRHAWVSELDRITGARVRRGKRHPVPAAAPGFTDVNRAEFTHHHPVTRESLAALLQTFSYYLLLDQQARAHLLRQVDDLVVRHPDVAGRETFELPYVTRCWRATRL